MVTTILHIITFAFYLILIGFACVYLIRKYLDKCNQNVTKEEEQARHYLRLSTLRSNYFPEDMNYKSYFIKEYLLEPFNIFISLNPQIISTMTKVQKALIVLDTELDNPMMTAEDLQSKLTQLDVALDEMTLVFDQIMDRMKLIIAEATDKETEIELHSKAIEVYVEIVNTTISLADSHGVISPSVHTKIEELFQDYVERYREISRKIIYLYFMTTRACADQLDEWITIYL